MVERNLRQGYFQNTMRLSDGSAVGLSVGKYFTPKGVSLAGVGITPDVVVPVDEETAAAIYYDQLEPEDDPQIQAALEPWKAGNNLTGGRIDGAQCDHLSPPWERWSSAASTERGNWGAVISPSHLGTASQRESQGCVKCHGK